MESIGVQKPEAVTHLREGIVLLLSGWNGLQMAVKNQWGGRDSLQKSHQLATDIFSWFFQSRGLNYDPLFPLSSSSFFLNQTIAECC